MHNVRKKGLKYPYTSDECAEPALHICVLPPESDVVKSFDIRWLSVADLILIKDEGQQGQ